MEYRTFLTFNVVGGVAWITSMLAIGYFLDDALKQVFGPEFMIAKHVDKVVIVVDVQAVVIAADAVVHKDLVTKVF